MATIWEHCFYKVLKVAPEESKCLFTAGPLTPDMNKEKMCQLIFENFEVQAFQVQTDAVLALNASGRTTGVVLDSGHGVTHSVPIYDNNVIAQGVGRINLAGSDINEFITEKLSEHGYSFTKSIEH